MQKILCILMLSGFFSGSGYADQVKDTKTTKSPQSTAVEASAVPADTDKPGQTNPAGSPMTEVPGDLLEATVSIVVFGAIATVIVCYVLVKRTDKLQTAVAGLAQQQTLNQLRDELAPLAREATVAQVQNAMAPLAQINAAAGALPTLAQIQAAFPALQNLAADLAELKQAVALIRGSNDSVLNLVGRLVPGLPPLISRIEPAHAAAASEVMLFGNNFAAGSDVYFGIARGQVAGLAAGSIRVTVPAGANGTLHVYVQGPIGISPPYEFQIP